MPILAYNYHYVKYEAVRRVYYPFIQCENIHFYFIDPLLTDAPKLTNSLKYFHTLYSLLYPYIIQFIIYYTLYHT